MSRHEQRAPFVEKSRWSPAARSCLPCTGATPSSAGIVPQFVHFVHQQLLEKITVILGTCTGTVKTGILYKIQLKMFYTKKIKLDTYFRSFPPNILQNVNT